MNRKYILVVLCVLICGLFNGCGSAGKDFIWGTEYAHMNTVIWEKQQVSIVIPYAYRGEWKQVAFVSAEGENLENAEIGVVSENDMEDVYVVKNNNYTFGMLGIIIRPIQAGNLKLNKIKVSIDEREEEIVFSEPLKVEIIPAEENSEISVYAMPGLIFDGVEQELKY